MWRYLKYGLGNFITLGLIFYVLELLNNPVNPPDSWTSIINFGDGITYLQKIAFKYKLFIGTVFGTAYVVFTTISQVKLFDKKRQYIDWLIKDFIDQNLNGDLSSNRVTIFEPSKGFPIYAYYLRSTIQNFIFFCRRRCLSYRISCIPRPFRIYYKVYTRIGQPNNKKRSSFFLAPNNQEEINGIVPLTYYKAIPVKKTLPALDPEELIKYKSISHIPEGDLKNRLLKYMELANVQKLGRLKMIRRLSCQIYALPFYINDANEQPRIIIFDSDNQSLGIADLQASIHNLAKRIETVIKIF